MYGSLPRKEGLLESTREIIFESLENALSKKEISSLRFKNTILLIHLTISVLGRKKRSRKGKKYGCSNASSDETHGRFPVITRLRKPFSD